MSRKPFFIVVDKQGVPVQECNIHTEWNAAHQDALGWRHDRGELEIYEVAIVAKYHCKKCYTGFMEEPLRDLHEEMCFENG